MNVEYEKRSKNLSSNWTFDPTVNSIEDSIEITILLRVLLIYKGCFIFKLFKRKKLFQFLSILWGQFFHDNTRMYILLIKGQIDFFIKKGNLTDYKSFCLILYYFSNKFHIMLFLHLFLWYLSNKSFIQQPTYFSIIKKAKT